MILDFILIFIVVTSVLLGYRKGMSQMLLSCAVFLFSIIIAMSVYNYISAQFLKSDYGVKLHDTIASGISEQIKEIENNAVEKAPYLALIIPNSNEENNTGMDDVSDKLANKAIKVVITIPLLIASFVLLRLAIFLFKALLSKATKLPVIHGIDALLGSFCGLLMGIICMSLTYLLASYIQFIPSMEFIADEFSSSLIVLLINDFIF